jgi:hypothetical protein
MEGNFAELVDEAARDLSLNDYQLSAAIGLLSGNRVYSPKQVNRLRAGQVKHPEPEVVERLIRILRLDPAEAFAAARVLPRGFNADHFRRLEFFTRVEVGAASVQGNPNSGRFQDFPAWRRGSDRRRRDRRHLHLVPQAERVPA